MAGQVGAIPADGRFFEPRRGPALLCLACRSRRGSVFAGPRLFSNPLLLGSIGASFAAQAAVLFIPGLRNLFGPPLSLADFGISVAAGAAPLLAIEILRGIDCSHA
jgi:Cation transporting ATPase, C-terminus